MNPLNYKLAQNYSHVGQPTETTKEKSIINRSTDSARYKASITHLNGMGLQSSTLGLNSTQIVNNPETFTTYFLVTLIL